MKTRFLLIVLFLFTSISYAFAASPPSLTITSPNEGSFVNQTVLIEAELTTIPRVRSVKFYIDNELVGEDTESPYQYRWDTTTYPDGSHEVYASMLQAPERPDPFDEGGLPILDSPKITVTIDNTPPEGIISINNDDASTGSIEVILTLSATDTLSGMDKMQFSNNGTHWSDPEDYATQRPWILTNGDGTKTVYAKFKDVVGNWSDPVSDTIVLDTTPPVVEITSPLDGEIFSTTPISVSGTVSDNIDDNPTVTVNEVEATVSLGQFSADNISVTLGDNTITVTATDSAGNSSSDSIAVTYDNTPPTTPTVTDDGDYTISLTELHATWTESTDPESGISEYQYSIGTSISDTDVVSWTSTGTDTEVTHTNLTLTQGQSYYFNVKAINGAGIESDEGHSNGITTIVDTTMPVNPIIFDDGRYTTSTTQLHAYWVSADPESGIIENQYSIGTEPGKIDVVNWTSIGTDTEITHTDLFLYHDQTYYFNVKSKNNVGMWSNVSSSDGIVVNAHIPVISTITPEDDSTFFTKTEFIINVDAQDEDIDPLEYRFLAENEIIQDWSSSSTCLWTALPTTTLIRKITCQVRDDKQGQTFQDVYYNVEIDLNDTTPPGTPIVTTDEYSNSLTSLHASWTCEDQESGIVEFQYAIATNPYIVDWTSAGTNTEVTHYGLELVEGQKYYFIVRTINGVGLTSPEAYSQTNTASKEVTIKITSPQDNSIITQNEFTIRGIAKGTNEIKINNKFVSVNQDGTFTGPTLVAPGYAKRKNIVDDTNHIIMSYPGPTKITAEAGGQTPAINVYYYQFFVKKTITYNDYSLYDGGTWTVEEWNLNLLTAPPFSNWQRNYRMIMDSLYWGQWTKYALNNDGAGYASYEEMSSGYTYTTPSKTCLTNLTIYTLPQIEGKKIPMTIVFKSYELSGYHPNISSYSFNGQTLQSLYEDGSSYNNAAYITLTNYTHDTDISLIADIPWYTITFPDLGGPGVDVTHRSKSFHSLRIDLLRLDLIIDGMSEKAEEAEGTEMRINANYDEHNGDTTQLEDFRHEGIVTNDFNLLSGQLDITSADTDNDGYHQTIRKGKYRLIYPGAKDKILIWKENPNGTYSKIESGKFYSVTLPIHYNLRIEGVKGSQTTNDVTIIAQFIPDGSKKGFSIHDVACLTVIETKFMLTFDDGPFAGKTMSVVNDLAKFYVNRKKVKAAFFMVGEDGSKGAASDMFKDEIEGVDDRADIAVQVDSRDHYVCNHTLRHYDFEFLPPTPQETVEYEINECDKIIETALSKKPDRLFRPPYWNDPPNMYKGATACGFFIVWGKSRFGDCNWPNPKPWREIAENTVNYLKSNIWNTKEKPSKKDKPAIICYHEYHAPIWMHIKDIVEYLQDEGFVLETFHKDRCNSDKNYYLKP